MTSSLDLDRAHPARGRRRHPVSADGGFTIVETMMALMILFLVMTAALAVMASSLTLTRNNRGRSVAANLASQEMDVVRSTDFTDLPVGQVNSSQTVDGVPYAITRDSTWVTATSSATPCDGGSGSSYSFLRVTVTVTWANMSGVQPVTSETVVTPPVGSYDPNSGHIAVKVFDGDAYPQENVPVTAVGPGYNRTQTTTLEGCTLFAFLQAGTYAVTLNRSGYVDGQGVTAPSQSVSVTVGSTASAQFDYDQAATLSLTLSGVAGGSVPAGVPVTLGNTRIIPTGTKAFVGSGAVRSLTGLFPYAAGYSAWSGGCGDSDPQGQKPDGTGAYYPGATRDPPLAAEPGMVTSGTVLTPTARLHVAKPSGTPVASATVVAVHASDNVCSAGATFTLGTTDIDGNLTTALPFGTWTFSVNGYSPAVAWPVATLSPPAAASDIDVRVQ